MNKNWKAEAVENQVQVFTSTKNSVTTIKKLIYLHLKLQKTNYVFQTKPSIHNMTHSRIARNKVRCTLFLLQEVEFL